MFEKVTRTRLLGRGFLKFPAVMAAVAAHAAGAYGLTAMYRDGSTRNDSVELVTYLMVSTPRFVDAPPVRSTPRRDPAPADRTARGSRPLHRPKPTTPAPAGPREAELQLEGAAELALATIPRTLDVIPPSGPALDSALLRGLGEVALREASGVSGGGSAEAAEEPGAAPVVEGEVFATPPRMLNRFLIRRMMGSDYPPALLFRGVEGQVLVSFIIGLDGHPEMDHVQVVSATHQAFIPAALRGLRRMRFRPAQLDGRGVRVRVSLPLVWRLPPR